MLTDAKTAALRRWEDWQLEQPVTSWCEPCQLTADMRRLFRHGPPVGGLPDENRKLVREADTLIDEMLPFGSAWTTQSGEEVESMGSHIGRVMVRDLTTGRIDRLRVSALIEEVSA